MDLTSPSLLPCSLWQLRLSSNLCSTLKPRMMRQAPASTAVMRFRVVAASPTTASTSAARLLFMLLVALQLIQASNIRATVPVEFC